ncbi:MAG: hypothetical protein ACI4JQ_05460 [Ruminococcus sp.]
MKETTEKKLARLRKRMEGLTAQIQKLTADKEKCQQEIDKITSAELLRAYKNAGIPVEQIGTVLAIGSEMKKAGYSLKDAQELTSEPESKSNSSANGGMQK